MDSMTKEELNRHLLALTGSENLVQQWWETPNRAWRGREPQAVWAENPREVWDYVMRFCYGDYS